MTKIRKDLQIIEVLANPDTFKNSKSDVLVDESNAKFYKANLEELKHIDQERQLAAIQRLSNTQKFSLRSDIAKQFKVLVALDSFEHKETTVEALIHTLNVPVEAMPRLLSHFRSIFYPR